MTLREIVISTPETLSELAWAGGERFREGEALIEASHFSGAIYVLGLSAEMSLKQACFRLLGAGPATPIAGLLGPARAWMRLQAPTVAHESFHSLLFWVEFMVRRRAVMSRPLPADLTGRLRHHVANRLFYDWRIDMRYRHLAISERDAWRVYNDAYWVRGAAGLLWRF